VQVDDHELWYADFEGVIEEGSYGAGEVEIWDKGTYEIVEEKADSLKFRVTGQRMKGVWKLIHTRYPPGNKWLLIASEESEIVSDNGS
jgi:bifunctional non-homologous end joining protein LigD